MKSHRSHDIVLLCIDCHMLAHTAADRLRRAYAERFDAPLQPRRGSRARGDATAGSGGEDDAPDAHTARRSALVLETKDDLPEGRRRELEMTILRCAAQNSRCHAIGESGTRPRVGNDAVRS